MPRTTLTRSRSRPLPSKAARSRPGLRSCGRNNLLFLVIISDCNRCGLFSLSLRKERLPFLLPRSTPSLSLGFLFRWRFISLVFHHCSLSRVFLPFLVDIDAIRASEHVATSDPAPHTGGRRSSLQGMVVVVLAQCWVTSTQPGIAHLPVLLAVAHPGTSRRL